MKPISRSYIPTVDDLGDHIVDLMDEIHHAIRLLESGDSCEALAVLLKLAYPEATSPASTETGE